jgi:hypothetical protein
MEVIKADGTMEVFNANKLRGSLRRSGAKEKDIDYIVSHIESEIGSGDSTAKIYKHAFAILKKRERVSAARYSLRRSVSELGPSGFPFETFLSEIFKSQGYTIETGAVLMGKCMEYEIDIVASRDKDLVIGEAKFHNQHGIKSDLKVALYVNARFEDLDKTNFGGRLQSEMSCKCLLITNTKFTRNAIKYGKCVGMDMIGWSYPKEGSLQNLIEKAHIEPLTSLTTLTSHEKRALLEGGIVLCRSLLNNREALISVGVPKSKVEYVIEEVLELCKI